MKRKGLAGAVSAGVLAIAACAHTVPVDGGTTSAASVSTSVGGGNWSGRIASVLQNRGDVAQSTRDNSYGSASWTRGDSPTLSTVNLTFTYAGTERDLSWALIGGSCGMSAPPLIPMTNFPELNIGSSGRAQLTATLPIDLPSSGAYHVDIYKSRSGGAENLVGCGNLRYSK
jgi:hypothetical protein